MQYLVCLVVTAIFALAANSCARSARAVSVYEPPGACKAASAKVHALGCKFAVDNFDEVCSRSYAAGVDFNAECVSRAASCLEADRCPR